MDFKKYIKAETSIVMMIYLDDAIKEMKQRVTNMTKSDIFSAVYIGAVFKTSSKTYNNVFNYWRIIAYNVYR